MVEKPPILYTDEDILEAIHAFIRSYDPLRMSRSHLHIAVHSGVVTISGYVKNARTHELLINALPNLEGVVAVDANHLYDDDNLLMKVGKRIPRGTRARVDHGRVTLMGQRPSDPEALMDDIGELEGIHSIGTDFFD